MPCLASGGGDAPPFNADKASGRVKARFRLRLSVCVRRVASEGLAAREGHEPAEAIRRACLLRFRPILMTTMAALLGGVPLMLGSGAGSEIRQPLGYTIVGGLILSQLLTLFTTPVVYIYLDRLQDFLRRWRGSIQPAKAVA